MFSANDRIKVRTFIHIFSMVCICWNGMTQISPPGLGAAHSASWFAAGIRQDIDSAGNWQSVSYAGFGRKSNPTNYSPFYKPEIFVVNQEFYHTFRKNWQYSVALSYRRQDEYQDSYPFERETPGIVQEFRFYSRLSYVFKTPRIKFVPTIRQDVRTFFNPDFSTPDEVFQLRSRFRMQLTVNLTKTANHKLITSAEQLFAASQERNEKMGAFNYRESRFCLYYSYSPSRIPVVINLGYMNNLIGNQKPYSVHYLAVDVIIQNPFGSK